MALELEVEKEFAPFGHVLSMMNEYGGNAYDLKTCIEAVNERISPYHVPRRYERLKDPEERLAPHTAAAFYTFLKSEVDEGRFDLDAANHVLAEVGGPVQMKMFEENFHYLCNSKAIDKVAFLSDYRKRN